MREEVGSADGRPTASLLTLWPLTWLVGWLAVELEVHSFGTVVCVYFWCCV